MKVREGLGQRSVFRNVSFKETRVSRIDGDCTTYISSSYSKMQTVPIWIFTLNLTMIGRVNRLDIRFTLVDVATNCLGI
jgi:hypothetical protein